MIEGIDHIVLAVADVDRTCAFYARHLKMEVREETPGKFALHFGTQKISLQQADTIPQIARNTTPGSGNICFLSSTPVAILAAQLKEEGIEILVEPSERLGATGPILSVYFKDPDGNLIEIANPL